MELGTPEGQIGAIDIACDVSCVIARATSRTIDLSFVAPGRVTSEDYVDKGSARLFSDPVVTAQGGRFFVGWLESEKGVTATVRVATVQAGGPPRVTTVAEDVPTGGDPPTIPQPLGIVLKPRSPSLVWLTSSYVDQQQRLQLHVAGPRGRTVKAIDAWLTDATVAAPTSPTIVAVASAPRGQPDPVSVSIP